MQNHDLFGFTSNEKQKKILKSSIIAFIIVFAIILIAAGIRAFINRDKTAIINILVAPTDAEVVIGDKTYGTDGEIKVKPGDYKITISKEGFNTYEENLSIKADEIYNLYEYLEESDENGTFYQENTREGSRAQEVADKKADDDSSNYSDSDPIWNVVPYENYQQGIRISAEPATDTSGKITINIRLLTCSDTKFASLKQNAIDYLTEQKITLENYTVNYSKAC